MIRILRLDTTEFDPDTVTPGVIGFIITFLVAAITVLLVLDMTRRIRRLRYREEVREQLDAEEAEAAAIAEAEGIIGEAPAQDPRADPAPKE